MQDFKAMLRRVCMRGNSLAARTAHKICSQSLPLENTLRQRQSVRRSGDRAAPYQAACFAPCGPLYQLAIVRQSCETLALPPRFISPQ